MTARNEPGFSCPFILTQITRIDADENKKGISLIPAGIAPRGQSECAPMKLEHFAMQVPDPIAMADWYVKHLGCTIARAGGEPSHGRFLTVGGVLFEIYRNPRVTVPDYAKVDPLLIHLAFTSQNLMADRDRLIKAGARIVDDIANTPAGDEIMMLRDPWNIPIQFVKRAEPML